MASELKPSSPFKPRPGTSDAQIEGNMSVLYCIEKTKAGESQGRAPGQASDYALRDPTILTVAPIIRHFTKISGPQLSPRYFAPPAPPPLSPALEKTLIQTFAYQLSSTLMQLLFLFDEDMRVKKISPVKLSENFDNCFISEIRSKLESRCSPRVFSHQNRAPPSRHSSRAVAQQSVYVPPAQSLDATAQRPPSHQSIKSQQSVLKSILEYKPEKE